MQLVNHPRRGDREWRNVNQKWGDIMKSWNFLQASRAIVLCALAITQTTEGLGQTTTPKGFQPIKADPPRMPQRVIGGVDARSEFPNVGKVVAYTNGQVPLVGTGTLVHSRWMLTAAHVVDGCLKQGGYIGFFVNGTYYWADGYAKHQNYGRYASNGLPLGDIAMVRLSQAVPTSVRPANIQTSAGYVGQVVTIVGFGDTGTGSGGTQNGSSGVKRKGTARVEQVGSDWLIWKFDRGEQYSTAHGDSGGPEFNANGAIATITTGGDGRGVGETGWGNKCWNTRCDIHFAWMKDLVTRYTPAAVPSGVRMLVQPQYAAGEVLDALPSLPGFGLRPSSLLSSRSLE